VNAQQYAELIEKHLLSYQYIEDNPRFPSEIQIPESDPNSLFWSDRIDFRQDLRLTVMEQAVFCDDQLVERAFSYDLREIATGKLIWRIDNHSRRQSVDAPCHVHVLPDDPPNSRTPLFENSRTAIFPYAIHCIKNYFEGKPQEWEEPGNGKIS
jgi:hypothetical protein